MIDPMKTCKNCFARLPTSQFHKNKASKDGFQYKCKKCAIECVLIGRKEKIQKRWDVIYKMEYTK